MGHADQCPSKGAYESKPRKVAPSDVGVGPTGKAYWRSLDDLADTREFRDWLEREFPAGASELLDSSRRTFMKLMGAGLALAGAATLPGCRRPDHKIMPYAKEVPEEVIPGKPLYFATSIAFGGTVEGLLVETHENRPTKTEGNPLHPVNRGRSSVWGQACVLSVYDPDRLKDPVFTDAGEKPRSWDDFAAWSTQHFAPYDASGGQGLAFIVDKKRSPSLRAMRERIARRWPNAAWVWYDATQVDAPIQGTRIAFGSPQHEVLHLERAKVIVSLDRDFLSCEGRGLVHAREFAATRRMLTTADADRMSRLYAIESNFTATGGKADHRMALPPSQITAFAMALYARVLAMTGKGSAQAPSVPEGWAKWIEAIAGDLESNPGAGLIVAGPSQPAEVHAAAAAMNAALGSVGKTVSYVPMDEVDADSSAEAISALAGRMKAGEISTAVVIGANPVYNAPAELDFAAAYAKVPTRIALSVDPSETVAASNWRLPAAHDLESWGDTQTIDGVVAPTQPMIAPLYGGKSEIETLAIIAGDDLAAADGYKIVRDVWRTRLVSEDEAGFERRWRRALHDGVLNADAARTGAPAVRFDAVASAAGSLRIPGAPTAQALEVVFAHTHMGDGRWANNPWLQELPDPATRMVWDNAALVSPATAKALGLTQEGETVKFREAVLATLSVGGRSMEIAVWAVPGIADNTVVLPLGWGRAVTGLVGTGTGFNTFLVRTAAAQGAASGATLASSGRGGYPISTTQTHGSMEGRAIVREIDVQAWKKHGDDPAVTQTDAYGRPRTLNLAERLDGAEMTHMPANRSIYKNPYNQSDADAAAGSPYSKPPQWGMSIDLATCTGCGVCTIACQAENNIPVVGKIEVSKGREMTWIRVDRYFTGESADSVDSMVYQPLPCVHCENAPCETVCPVNATVHGPEGINYMAYNRCIGTRYCANNCPYKVRRFNFFDFGPAKFNGHYVGREVLGGVVQNPNLVPPRLRERLDEISRAQKNPDVTVRSRGVMEKCSFCIQRINEARIEAKLSDLSVKAPDGSVAPIPDGLVQTACQQACPSDSIVFGDILDKASNDGAGSRIRRMREHQRSYMLLGYLNTRPRTTHMIGVRNPNPLLRKPTEDPFGHHGSGHDGHDHDHDHDHGAPHGAQAQPSAGEGVPHSMLPLTAPADRGVKVRLPVLGGIA